MLLAKLTSRWSHAPGERHPYVRRLRPVGVPMLTANEYPVYGSTRCCSSCVDLSVQASADAGFSSRRHALGGRRVGEAVP